MPRDLHGRSFRQGQDLAAADNGTVFAFQNAIAQQQATAAAERTTRKPGEPGVRLPCFVDLGSAACHR
jgi:hypothetical protein